MSKQISNFDIHDLMVAALEGGINYWCNEVRIKEYPSDIKDGEVMEASEIISRGGKLELSDDDEVWELDKVKFLKGLKKVMVWGDFDNVEDLMEVHDAETVDVLIQYALFDEIVFG